MIDAKENLLLKSECSLKVVKIMQIIGAEKKGKKVKIITSDKELETVKSLQEIEQELGKMFYRIHYNTLVNLLRIKELLLEENKVIMENNKAYPVAKRRKKEFIGILNKNCKAII